jgi:hypothetical protein
MLPPGVACELIRQARSDEDHPGAVPYLDAFEAEAALQANGPERALQLAYRARQTLPNPGENVLRALSASVGALAAARLGRNSESLELWNQVLIEFPAALRVQGLAIPATIRDDGSPLARRVAKTLASSPRLRSSQRGFVVRIEASGESLSLSVIRPDGQRHFERAIPAVDDPAQVVAAASKIFHECLLSPGMRLSVVEINSLDGVPLDDTGRRLIDSLAGKKAQK